MKTVKTKTYLIKKTKIDLAIFYFILSMENAIEVDGLMVLFFIWNNRCDIFGLIQVLNLYVCGTNKMSDSSSFMSLTKRWVQTSVSRTELVLFLTLKVSWASWWERKLEIFYPEKLEIFYLNKIDILLICELFFLPWRKRPQGL
jgi:hypothetical protein